MPTTDNYKHLSLIFGGLAALSGISALLLYFENKKQRELKEQLLKTDLELKGLELEYRKTKGI